MRSLTAIQRWCATGPRSGRRRWPQIGSAPTGAILPIFATLLCLCFCLPPLHAAPAQAAQAISEAEPSLVPSQVSASPAARRVGADLILLGKANDQLLDVAVLSLNAAGAPRIDASVAPGRTQTSPAGQYVIHVSADGIPLNYSETEYIRASFKISGVKILPFVLTNMGSEKQPLISASVPAAIAVKPGELIPLDIGAGAAAIDGLKIEQRTLSETRTRRALGHDALKLCEIQAGRRTCPSAGLSLQPYTHYRLWISGVDRPGQYDGAITLVSIQTPQGAATGATSVFVTDDTAKILGASLIAAGVLLSWLLTDVLRSLASRYAWLARAKKLQLAILALDHRLAACALAGKAPIIKAKMAEQTAALAPDRLAQNGLPKPMPTGYLGINGDVQPSDLQAYLAKIQQWISVLGVLIEEGLGEVDRRTAAAAANHNPASDYARIDQIADKILDEPPTVADTRVALNQILNPPPPGAAHMIAPFFGPGLKAATPTLETLEAQVALINGAAWLGVIAITILAGCYALFVSNLSASFGTPLDDWAAFLWGLGFPLGTQIAQSAVTSAIGAVRKI